MSDIVWIGFFALIILLLMVDLKGFNRNAHEVKIKEALWQSAFWIALSLIFCAVIYFTDDFGSGNGHNQALNFLTGYLIEKSLSMDNLFVFVMLFSFFGIPAKYQHEVLFWGIFGALVMRGIFIFAGVALINQFSWVIYIFGIFLIYTGVKMAMEKEGVKLEPNKNPIVKLFKRFFPVTDTLHEGKFFIKDNHKLMATPLFVALLVIECSDIIFAVDSIPAVLAISHDSFIVFTSNVFAILGLRALYFALAGITKYFVYLKYGLAIILTFIGVKMILGGEPEILPVHVEIPTAISLCVVFGLLILSIVASLLFGKKPDESGAKG